MTKRLKIGRWAKFTTQELSMLRKAISAHAPVKVTTSIDQTNKQLLAEIKERMKLDAESKQ